MQRYSIAKVLLYKYNMLFNRRDEYLSVVCGCFFTIDITKPQIFPTFTPTVISVRPKFQWFALYDPKKRREQAPSGDASCHSFATLPFAPSIIRLSDHGSQFNLPRMKVPFSSRPRRKGGLISERCERRRSDRSFRTRNVMSTIVKQFGQFVAGRPQRSVASRARGWPTASAVYRRDG